LIGKNGLQGGKLSACWVECIRLNGKHSDWVYVLSGVPQGSIFVVSIYTDDPVHSLSIIYYYYLLLLMIFM